MRIQCGRAQTGFNPVQCALSAQCGQALTFEQVCIERISILNLRSRDLLTSESMAVAGDLDSSEDKSVYSWPPYN